MFSSMIYNEIFEPDETGKKLAEVYARTGQADVGLEWLYRHSPRVSLFLAYLRVKESAQDACLFFNEFIGNMVDTISMTPYSAVDDDYISCETMHAVSFIMETIPSAEDILVEGIISEINRTKETTRDSVKLKSWSSF